LDLQPTGSSEKHLFVVRVRLDPQEGEPERLMGSVDHIERGERLYFSRLDELSVILADRLFGTKSS
jgi:hypothetical protein